MMITVIKYLLAALCVAVKKYKNKKNQCNSCEFLHLFTIRLLSVYLSVL